MAVKGNGEEAGVKTDFVISHLFSCKEQWEEQWEDLAVWAVTAPEIYKYLCLDTVEDDLTKAGGRGVSHEQHRGSAPNSLSDRREQSVCCDLLVALLASRRYVSVSFRSLPVCCFLPDVTARFFKPAH